MAEKKEVAVVNDQFINTLGDQLKKKEELGIVFPKDYNYRNELMGAYLVLKETVDKDKKPVLQSCSSSSVAQTLMDMATLGVSMQKKQCYPVAYGGKLQCQISVYGNTCIARRYGLKEINAMCIYEGDTFKYHIENAKIVLDEHSQDFMNLNTDKIIGAYCVVEMESGEKYIEVMNMNMIKQSWKQGFGYREGGTGTHQKFTDQMAMKTVKNRALKYIIRTYGTQLENDSYNEFEKTETDDRNMKDYENDIESEANTEEFVEAEFKEVEQEEQIEKVEAEIVTEEDIMKEAEEAFN